MAVFAGISCVRESRPGGGSNLLVSKQTGRFRRNGSRKESGQIRKGSSCRPPHISVPKRKYSKSNRAVQEELKVMAGGRSLERLERGRVADLPIFQYLKDKQSVRGMNVMAVGRSLDRLGPCGLLCLYVTIILIIHWLNIAFLLPLPLPIGHSANL